MSDSKEETNKITGVVLDCSVRLHSDLGPGLLESVYEQLLGHLITQQGFQVATQVPIDFQYDGMTFTNGFRIDMIIEKRVVVELKSVESLLPVHQKQLLTYLRLLNLPIGLLLNFGAPTMKEGFKRVLNNRHPEAGLFR
jgi:GxxExxY protein